MEVAGIDAGNNAVGGVLGGRDLKSLKALRSHHKVKQELENERAGEQEVVGRYEKVVLLIEGRCCIEH